MPDEIDDRQVTRSITSTKRDPRPLKVRFRWICLGLITAVCVVVAWLRAPLPNVGLVNVAMAQAPTGPIVGLTVSKNDTGSGTVTGSSINCGPRCFEVVSLGATISLTASAATGARFVRWDGCTSSNGATCKVVMNRDTAVTAIFSTPGPTLLVPASTRTGKYIIEFGCGEGHLCSTHFVIEEDDNISFSSPARYFYDGGSPRGYAFNKKTGTYCYRVSISNSGPWSTTACIVVSAPASPLTDLAHSGLSMRPNMI